MLALKSIKVLVICLLVFPLAPEMGRPNGYAHLDVPFSLDVRPWPEADKLFRRDKRWLGGDDAYSIYLGKNRVLWLFADSFIALDESRDRKNSAMVRNSVAIQNGLDPSSADITFYWRTKRKSPSSFFAESGDVWYWPGDGIRLDDRLLIFLMKVRGIETGLGFEVFGWSAVLITNPDKEPNRWKIRWLDTPTNDFGVIVGSASVIRHNGYILAFGSEEPAVHNVFIARWPVELAAKGRLSELEWWTGNTTGWLRQSEIQARPKPVFPDAQTEFTVHFEPRLNGFLEIQTVGFGAADIGFRWTRAVTGRWTDLKIFYQPEEAGRNDVLIYAGKSHPELQGADLVLTYVVNATRFSTLVQDTSLYYPRFLKVSLHSPKNVPQE